MLDLLHTSDFDDYIFRTRKRVQRYRTTQQAIDANSPFELHPTQSIAGGNKLKYGALLIHGLLDSPFSLRDIGAHLQANGIMSRAVLLPGHGTIPDDLLSVSYHDWIATVRYGIESMREQVDHLFLIGYSTGAALSIYHALHDAHIAGIILLSPAIRIKAPVDIVVGYHYLMQRLRGQTPTWLYREKEMDYAKYKSVCFNAVQQVASLTQIVQQLRKEKTLHTPMLMIMSREDETISSKHAIHFFSSFSHEASQLLLYSAHNPLYADTRVMVRSSIFPTLNIRHFSHVSIPFAPNNLHYGQQGDYAFASHFVQSGMQYGAYNRIEERCFDYAYRLGVTKKRLHELTYNPDFDFMSNQIVKFMVGH